MTVWPNGWSPSVRRLQRLEGLPRFGAGQSATDAPGFVSEKNWQPPTAGWGWFIGQLFGITFTSPKAFLLANLSALGFLGFLSFLSYAPVPGAHYFKIFSGLYGLFGLVGFAFMVEFANRPHAKTPGLAQLSVFEFWSALERGHYAQSWEAAAPLFFSTASAKRTGSRRWKKSAGRWARPDPKKRAPSLSHPTGRSWTQFMKRPSTAR